MEATIDSTRTPLIQAISQGSNKLRAEIGKPWQHLCCCTGWLSHPQEALESLLKAPIPTARPYLAEQGGVWGDPWDDRWIALKR